MSGCKTVLQPQTVFLLVHQTIVEAHGACLQLCNPVLPF